MASVLVEKKTYQLHLRAQYVQLSLTVWMHYMTTWRSIWKHHSRCCYALVSAAMDRWAANSSTLAGPAVKRRQVGGDKEELIVKVMQLLLKNNLKLAADVRALQSATFRTCLIPSTASFVVKAKEASQKYNELVQAAGKNHEYGPPHVHVWAAIAAEAAVHMSGDARAVLDRHISEIDSPDKLLQDVLYCRVAPAYGGKHVKIYLTTTEKLRPVADVFFQAFKTQQGEEKFGQAPKGGLERELQTLLEEIQSK